MSIPEGEAIATMAETSTTTTATVRKVAGAEARRKVVVNRMAETTRKNLHAAHRHHPATKEEAEEKVWPDPTDRTTGAPHLPETEKRTTTLVTAWTLTEIHMSAHDALELGSEKRRHPEASTLGYPEA